MDQPRKILDEIKLLQGKVEEKISGMDLLYDFANGTAKLVDPKGILGDSTEPDTSTSKCLLENTNARIAYYSFDDDFTLGPKQHPDVVEYILVIAGELTINK